MAVMLVTTCLTSLVIILCWHKPPIIALFFLLIFGSIELLYFSASLVKFREGAWLPILLALFLVTVMFVWHYATIKKYEYDLHNKVSLEWLLALGPTLGICRVPGIGLVFTDLTSGIPANFSRFVTNLPAFHRILVFVCVKSVPVPFVPPAERYLFGRVGPASLRAYRCIIRYGYRDVHQDVDSFESDLVKRLADFIHYDWCRPRPSNGRGKHRGTPLMAYGKIDTQMSSSCESIFSRNFFLLRQSVFIVRPVQVTRIMHRLQNGLRENTD